MLPKQFRLRSNKDFEDLWKRGRSVYGHFLGLRFAPNQFGAPRIGIVIGTKIHKRATKRNLAKRRIREAIRREYLARLGAHDITVIGRAGIIERSYQEIVDELGDLFGRTHLLS